MAALGKEATAAIHVIHGRQPDGKIREFPVAFFGKLVGEFGEFRLT